MHILDLPDTVLMDILELLSYDEVARKREVCARFNYICQQVLNTGFNKVVMEHAKHFRRIKALLPRRESERRNHTLARHSDVLTSIETRISMLTMTYSKFIDSNLCCFIPGRVLDEISAILKLVGSSPKQLRPHEVLQELRDISSMAIEHFDERIAVNFKPVIKLNDAASSSRVVVCGALGDISFSGVKVSPLDRARQRPPQAEYNEMLTYVNQNNEEYMQQCDCYRLNRHVHRQWLTQKMLCSKVRFLEWSRKAQDRRLQDALSSITELAAQVSELKRQLEVKPTTSVMSTGAVKRSTVGTDCMQPSKKPKAQ
ncbi:GH16208 [Drosophila grimshawi]|uniref:GH16208 n=2 Tax=Drosophila grimshawi TaxID=7222 RepID=B4IX59_DROGR|nr:GH16208 [Drosophila grimshawi]